MTQEEKMDADREYGNFHTAPNWQAYLNQKQTTYLFQERGDFLFCNGHGRTMKQDLVTPNVHKVYTVPFK